MTETPQPTPGPPVPGPPVPGPPVPGPPRPQGVPGSTESTGSTGSESAPDLGDHATGDIVIDSALQDLRDAPADDLDAQIEAGRRVHQTLQGRLSHLGGE